MLGYGGEEEEEEEEGHLRFASRARFFNVVMSSTCYMYALPSFFAGASGALFLPSYSRSRGKKEEGKKNLLKKKLYTF